MDGTPQAQRFSWGGWIGGFLAAFVLGSFGNAVVIAIGFQINVTAISTILGILPGLIMIVISRRTQRNSFASGLLVGACLIALLGGICGAVGTATQEKA